VTTFDTAARDVGVLWPQPRGVPNVDPEALDCWAVSHILDTLHRFGLEYWKLQQVARTAYARRDTFDVHSEQEVIDFLAAQKNWVGTGHELSERDLGSAVHAAVERYILEDSRAGDYHDEAAPFVRQWFSWLDTYKPRFIAAEMTVYDPERLYAGTCDAIVELSDGHRYLLDWKTTRNARDKQGHVRTPYAEWALQLAAYRNAPLAVPVRVDVPAGDERSPRHYYITPQHRAVSVPMPEVDGCAIVQLTPDDWRMWPVRVDDDARDAFLYLREVTRFVEVIARRSVFGSYVEGAA